jgi:DNA (cytosine-5)-methyltransferase 1
MDHLALFNGIGGFQLAASWMGWNNIAHVEIDQWCNSKVAKHFPESKCYLDIKDFNGKEYEGKIDIITGGFPCQPFSVAGKQKGKGDDRHLWPEMFRVIREVRSPFIVGENVPGIIGMELENICLALEGEGYEVQPFIIPSASVGAWDKRERVWIIAYNQESRKRKLSVQQWGQNPAGNINFNRQIEVNSNFEGAIGKQSGNTRDGWNGCPDSDCYIDCEVLEGYARYEQTKRESETIRRTGQANWLRDWIEVASELCRSNARVSHRVDRIRALGNSVNPYVPYQIFKAIELTYL